MSKAVLVIDMPNTCGGCILCQNRRGHCVCSHPFDGENGDVVLNKVDIEQERPNWCPLQQMPEKSHTGKSDYYQWGDWEDGWNACIDGLLLD